MCHIAFEALDEFKRKNERMPGVWQKADGDLFVGYAKEISKRYGMDAWKECELKLLYLFSFTCQGVLNPLCSFQGGVVAQECIKGIT